jgi:hypothetical protein
MKRPFCQNPECQHYSIEVEDDVFRISDIDKRVERKLYEDEQGRKKFFCENCYVKAEEKDDK